MRSLARVLVAALLALAPGACASAGGAPLTQAQFAPEAEVDLAAMRRHERGFYFRDVRAGSGRAAEPGRRVQVEYLVRLPDGRVVDRSAPGAPLAMTLGRREGIVALELGLRGMREGGVRQIVAPPELAYGARGTGAVPPRATLVLLVQLLRVD